VTRSKRDIQYPLCTLVTLQFLHDETVQPEKVVCEASDDWSAENVGWVAVGLVEGEGACGDGVGWLVEDCGFYDLGSWRGG
jgi:hypothetical protein